MLSDEHNSVLGVEEELGICKDSLQRWKKKYKEGKLTNSKKKLINPNRAQPIQLRK